MDKKKKYMLIAIFCVIGLALGSTFAWFAWRSDDNTSITIRTGGITIKYDAGPNIEGRNLRPTASKEVGVTNNYAIKKDITVSSSKKTYLSLYLTVNELEPELQDKRLKWELYENISDNVFLLSSGNFEDVSEEDRILLVGNTKTNDYIRNLTLYIWIDGNIDNSVEMGGKSYNFSLNADATDEKGEYIYNIPHTQISDTSYGVLSGSGTEEDPYLIESIEDLITFSKNVNSGITYKGEYISLKQTIDFNSDDSYVDTFDAGLFGDYNGDGETFGIKEEVTTGQGFVPIGLEPSEEVTGDEKTFKGIFLGNNNTIKNLYINYDENSTYDSKYLGLFGNINSSNIKDLSVTGTINFSEDKEVNSVGGIAGYAYFSEITNCNNYVNIIGNNDVAAEKYSVKIGGISGLIDGGSVITNCTNHESVNFIVTTVNQLCIGGIAGITSNSATIRNSNNYGSFNTFSESEVVRGGIIGYNRGTIANSNNYGDISINMQDKTLTVGYYLGGINGFNNFGLLIENINYGEIKVYMNAAYIHAGGIAAGNYGKLERCINSKTGDIDVTSESEEVVLGGLLGSNWNKHDIDIAIVVSSYNLGNVTGLGGGVDYRSRFGGIVGNNKGGIVSNTYTVGKVNGIGINTEYGLGGIVGGIHESATINNSYYLNTIEPLYGYTDGSAITITNSSSKTESEMKSSAFVDLLNAGLSEPVWVMDTEGINDGYPILSFQK